MITLHFEPEVLAQILDPSKRDPEQEKLRQATVRAAKELGKTLVIHPAPIYPDADKRQE